MVNELETKTVKRGTHPNSLANLDSQNRLHEKSPVTALSKKIRAYTDGGEEIFKVVYRIMTNSKVKAADRLHAAELLLNRGWGRPIETIIIDDISAETAALRAYSLPELQALRERLVIEGTYTDMSDMPHTDGGTPESGGVI